MIENYTGRVKKRIVPSRRPISPRRCLPFKDFTILIPRDPRIRKKLESTLQEHGKQLGSSPDENSQIYYEARIIGALLNSEGEEIHPYILFENLDNFRLKDYKTACRKVVQILTRSKTL